MPLFPGSLQIDALSCEASLGPNINETRLRYGIAKFVNQCHADYTCLKGK